MQDRFGQYTPGLEAPATRAQSVAPQDGASLPFRPRAIYVGVGGDLAVTGSDGVETVFRNLSAGTWLPFRAVVIRATGTTASDLVVLD